VDDFDGRDLLALAGQCASADVAQAPSDHFLRLDVRQQEGLLEARCPGDHCPLVIEDDGMAVEDQLVLPAHRVAKGDEA
jgi:hypothetical protein